MPENIEKLSRKNVKTQLNNLIEEFDTNPLQSVKIIKPKKPKKPKEPVKNKKINTKSSLQETINYLRVCIKYTVWDLEATRRENEYLKKLLENNSK